MMGHTITWDGGATAQIEFNAPAEEGSRYRLRYTPPYRRTLLPPVETLMVGPPDLENSRSLLNQFAESVGLITGRGNSGAGGEVAEPDKQLERIGHELFEYMLPTHVQADLDDETFIELALDEELIALPWEVMHDGQQFLSQRHAIGRFINLRSPIVANSARRALSGDLGDLKVLVVGVPRPTPTAEGEQYDELPGVEAEVEHIVETLTDIGVQPTLLLKNNATYDEVRKELHNPYHIIHYSGHAVFDDSQPSRSALLLFDRPLTTGALMVSFSQHPALLCFVNGCETSKPEEDQEGEALLTFGDRYNNYGLARSFLETGTYLLGSRWKLEDTAARTFAGSFYQALLGDGQPVGKAVASARRATAEGGDPSCAWASYIFYGDPRIGIRSSAAATASPQPAPPPAPAAAETPSEPVEEDPATTLNALATEYERTRQELPSGPQRTSALTQLVRRATDLALEGGVVSDLDQLYDGSDGGRVIALAQMKADPQAEFFDNTLKSITDSKSAFEQYLALDTARLLVPLIDTRQAEALRGAIETLSQDEDFFGTDRYSLGNQITTHLAQRVGEDVALA